MSDLILGDIDTFRKNLDILTEKNLSPLDFFQQLDLREKLVELVLNGEPKNLDQETARLFISMRKQLEEANVDDVKVVVFGGGSGLSNVIGGDSRLEGWAQDPFNGLKAILPRTKSIVCVTDDGGSTGELLKDLPLIALGDIRHVLLSSIQLSIIQKKYGLTFQEAKKVVEGLAVMFNYRMKEGECNREDVFNFCGEFVYFFPYVLQNFLIPLLDHIFTDSRLAKARERSHCLGNLLIVSAIYLELDSGYTNLQLEENPEILSNGISKGIDKLNTMLGCTERSVSPCTTTPCQLRICYTNGVQMTGESKSAHVLRGYPVDRVYVDFSDKVILPKNLLNDIKEADIILLAPGSLYSSIIPVFQVPGIAEAVRSNSSAQKILISNLWVQAGETDIAITDPDRKFHVSDMIKAYESNIPGGIADLFQEIICLSLKDVPGSILQNYAVEGKIPIYLDRHIVNELGLESIESTIYSKKALVERGVIQHDSDLLARTIKTLYLTAKLTGMHSHAGSEKIDIKSGYQSRSRQLSSYPSKNYRHLEEIIGTITIEDKSGKILNGNSSIQNKIIDVIWKHKDIPLDHLRYLKGIVFVDTEEWEREQKWDNVFSFFDPDDSKLKIRSDQVSEPRKFETAFLIGLGQSLLGNYAAQKKMADIVKEECVIGKVYNLLLVEEEKMNCFFNNNDLHRFLTLSRMKSMDNNKLHYTRLINGDEGFTPPGVLMGLTYAWYLDNALASHIEYKMALVKIKKSDLIPEQLRMLSRRKAVVEFFRERVFCSKK